VTITITKTKPPLAIGDRYVALPGSELQISLDRLTFMAGDKTDHLGCAMRLDERHPCGAMEFVVIEAPTP
jgi:hypothetical protein